MVNAFLINSDGHGALGHEVSLFLRENLPKTLDFEIKKKIKVSKMNRIIEEVFLTTNEKLVNKTLINTHFRYITKTKYQVVQLV